MILFLTNEEDITTDFVVKELAAGEFLRLNGDTFGFEDKIRYCCDEFGFGGEIQVGSRIARLDQIQAVYCRRLGMPSADSGIADEGVREYARVELRALIDNLFGLLRVRWMNHPLAVRRAESKLLQLAEARRVGLRVPRTLATNDGDAAVEFAYQCRSPIVVKAMSVPRLNVAGTEHMVYTSRVDPAQIGVLRDVTLGPCLIQEEIVKRSDVRVTVAGEHVFAVEIDSQSVPEAIVDWRAAPDVGHSVHNLPDVIKQSCLEICRALGLTFGAFDFAIDRKGNYVFFEVNPNGQWAWLQLKSGLPIASSIARFLLGV